MGIGFVTLRKRTKSLLAGIEAAPETDWRRARLNNVGRACRTPRIRDSMVRISRCPDDIRQIAVRGLGHEKPTLLLTSQTGTPTAGARRMVTGNAIAGAIDFFHMDALSAAAPMKIDLDLQLTPMASALYRLLALRLGRGQETAGTRSLIRDFVKAAADIRIEEDRIVVVIGRRANNPFLLNAGFAQTETRVPWLDGRAMRIEFV